MQLFLTSTCANVAADFADRFPWKPTGKKIAFITTAAETETGSRKWLANDRQSLVELGFVPMDYTLTGKNAQQLRADLGPMDALFVSGGNTFYLLQEAQKSGFVEVVRELVIKQNKPYIGSSAGSLVTGPDIYPAMRLDKVGDAPDIQGYEGIKLVNFIVFPHWGNDHFKHLYLQHRLEFAYKPDQHPIVMLTDQQYVWVEGDKLQICKC